MQSDRAENSIMQTITIAVSAILIAAGLVTAPGLINNARDNNATTDLANIAFAQEYAMATSGHYEDYVTEVDESSATGAPTTGNNLQTKTNVEGGVKFTLSGSVTDHKVIVCEDDFYISRSISSSDKMFFRASTNGVTSTDISKLSVPADVLAACPTILADITSTDTAGGAPFATPYMTAALFDYNYLQTDNTTDYTGFAWAATASDPGSAPVDSARIWVGSTEVTITSLNMPGVQLYQGDVYVSFPNEIQDDIANAGFTMEQFIADGWVSLTINGVPNNNIRLAL